MVSAKARILILLAILGGVTAYRIQGSREESSEVQREESSEVNHEESSEASREESSEVPISIRERASRSQERIKKNQENKQASKQEESRTIPMSLREDWDGKQRPSVRASRSQERLKKNEEESKTVKSLKRRRAEGKQQQPRSKRRKGDGKQLSPLVTLHNPAAASILQDAESTSGWTLPQSSKALSGIHHQRSAQLTWQMLLVITGIGSVFLFAGIAVFCNRVYATSRGRPIKKRARHETSGESPRSPKPVFAERKAHIHNGQTVFHWEQAEKLIKLYIDAPEGVRMTDLDIKIGTHALQVCCIGKEPFMKEELYSAINENKSVWRLRSNGELQIKLQKAVPAEWPRVLK